jgi:hypothetical protein
LDTAQAAADLHHTPGQGIVIDRLGGLRLRVAIVRGHVLRDNGFCGTFDLLAAFGVTYRHNALVSRLAVMVLPIAAARLALTLAPAVLFLRLVQRTVTVTVFKRIFVAFFACQSRVSPGSYVL